MDEVNAQVQGPTLKVVSVYYPLGSINVALKVIKPDEVPPFVPVTNTSRLAVSIYTLN